MSIALSAAVLLSVAGAGCGDANRVSVVLWHCGVAPIVYTSQVWDVAKPEPFDWTNAPDNFRGKGSVQFLDPDTLLYTDDGGPTLTFKPLAQLPPEPGCS
jgi:hypothetical protein